MRTGTEQALADVVAPVLDRLGLELFDIECVGSGRGRTVRVLVDRPGGVDLDAITAATEAISPVLDAHPRVEGLLPGRYTLEVSSPGLERPLRTPDHFARALGATVSLKLRVGDGHVRRRGVLRAADAVGIEVDFDGEVARLAYDDVVQARTVFEWRPAPRPGGPKRPAGSRR